MIAESSPEFVTTLPATPYLPLIPSSPLDSFIAVSSGDNYEGRHHPTADCFSTCPARPGRPDSFGTQHGSIGQASDVRRHSLAGIWDLELKG